jgi:hypothetical protein
MVARLAKQYPAGGGGWALAIALSLTFQSSSFFPSGRLLYRAANANRSRGNQRRTSANSGFQA